MLCLQAIILFNADLTVSADSLLTSPSHDAPSFTDQALDYIQWFRDAAPYINMHRDKTMVIMFGGEAVLDDNFNHIIQDIALLHALGIRLVLVHGARPQINQALAQLAIETPFLQQRRITTRQSISTVLGAVGAIRLQIEAMLSMGVAQSPMYGSRINVVSGNFVTAKPFGIHDGIDFQLTGEVRSVDAEAIQRHLATQSIIVLGPTAPSTTGEVFNLRAEDVATAVASAIQADKMIILGELNGIDDVRGHLIRELTTIAAQQLLSTPVIDAQQDRDPSVALNLTTAIRACQGGVRRCHLLSYRRNGALLQELFTRNGVGTLVSDAEFEGLRSASIADVGGLLNLLRPLEQQGVLVYRSRERLEREIEHFAVLERDAMIVACAALYPIATTTGELPAAEIACVAVHPDYRNSHRGAQILAFLQQQARQNGIKVLYVLTTHTGHWFMEQGFVKVDEHALPSARQALYNYQRNSQVFQKLL